MVSTASGTMDEIVGHIENLFTEVISVIEDQELQMTGPAFSYYTDYNPADGTTTLYCGIPVLKAGEPTDKVAAVTFPARKAIMALHTGPYEEFERSYTKMMEYVETHEIPVNWNAWEIYLNNPMEVKFPTLYETEIYFELEE